MPILSGSDTEVLKVQQFGKSVFVTDQDMGDPIHGTCLYAHKHATERQARKQSDALCREIAAGLAREHLSIAADIEKRLEAIRFLPPQWR